MLNVQQCEMMAESILRQFLFIGSLLDWEFLFVT